MTENDANTGLAEIADGDGAIARIGERANLASFTALLGVGVVLGAAAGALAARRSHSDEDVISGKVSIDLLKKVELLTVRLNLHRS